MTTPTADKIVEAMARRIAQDSPCQMTQAEAESVARAVLCTQHDLGLLLVAGVPERITPHAVPWKYGDSWEGVQEDADEGDLDAICNGYADGHNAARADVLARVVEVGK